MKRLLIVSVAVVALLGAAAACSSDSDDAKTNNGDALTFSDPSKTIEVTEGDTFTIKLESTPGTGYEWSVTGEPDSAVATLNDPEGVFTDASNDDGRVGAPGTTAFTLTATGPGTTDVTFTYARPFDPDDDPKEDTFTIKVS